MRDESGTIGATAALTSPRGDGAWRDLARWGWHALADWHAARTRERRDLRDLAHMTERELRDIGVSLGDIPAAADPHWLRDWPQ
jgi:uncharacterized protein YjiS (DUF1127 family)